MEHMEELVRSRRSVRTFDGNIIRPEDLEKLTAFSRRIENPYGIPVEFKLLDAKERKLKCPALHEPYRVSSKKEVHQGGRHAEGRQG